MLIALAFAHFSSELLLKEQMIIPVKKRSPTLVILTQNWSILAKFAKKIQLNRLFFTDCFLAKFPPTFPVKSADFSKNLPLKILRNSTFFHENPAKSADFTANLLLKIPQNFAFFSAKYQKPWGVNKSLIRKELLLLKNLIWGKKCNQQVKK